MPRIAMICGLALVAATVATLYSAPPDTAPPPTTQPTRQADPKMAYALGLGLGERIREGLKRDGLTADNDLIIRGLIDGLNDLPALYPDDEMQAAIARIEMTIRSRQMEKLMASDPSVKKLAEDNLAKSRKLLAQYAKFTNVEELEGGVLVREMTHGDGPFVGNAKWIIGRFEVSLADGTVIDQMNEKPRKFPTLRLAPAVLEAIRPMRVGSKWRIALPPEQAFGLAGRPPTIGPNQALIIDVELTGLE